MSRPPAPPVAEARSAGLPAERLPPLPKPEEITSLAQLFGVLKGRFDLEAELAELRAEREEWAGEGRPAPDVGATGE